MKKKELEIATTTYTVAYKKGYTQCQKDMVNEIQFLIDGYKSYILRLEEKFKDTCSALTLEKIVTLESVVENLESKFNKKD
jgi:hypothetical protein